jgi:hypothetical protein
MKRWLQARPKIHQKPIIRVGQTNTKVIVKVFDVTTRLPANRCGSHQTQVSDEKDSLKRQVRGKH